MPNKNKGKKQSGASRRRGGPTVVPKIAVRCGGPSDPPAMVSRPWNYAKLSGDFVTGGVGGANVTPATIAAELIKQVCPGASAATLEIRIRKISAWGQELIANGISYQSAVSLDIFNFVGGTGAGASFALSMQDAPGANHRSNVHAKIAPYAHIGNSTQPIFNAKVADGQSALVHVSLDWRYTASEGPGPLFRSVIPRVVEQTFEEFSDSD